MADLRGWLRRRRPPAPEDVDPELWAVLGRGARRGARLLETSTEIRHLIAETPRPEPDPEYRAQLRSRLIAEARLHARFGPRPHSRRRLGLTLGLGLGLAGAAMVALVLVSVLAVPLGSRSVTARAPVQGNPQVPVTQAIEVSFNQPMVERSVDRGLAIEPALAYRADWPSAKTLVIAAQHQLVPNVSYVVSIARQDARAQSGATPLSNIVIPFGTMSEASTAAGDPPSLVTVAPVAQASGAESLAYAGDGELLLLATGSVTVSGGRASGSQPAPGASSSPSAGPGGVVYTLTNPVEVLAQDAVAPAASPDSQLLAYWSTSTGGVSTLEVVPVGGSGQVQSLASTAAQSPQLAWLDDSDLLYSSAGRLFKVNLDGQASQVYPFVHLGQSGFFSVSPDGQALFAEPAGIPTVYDLANGSASQLPGLQGEPAWSRGTGQLAYVSDQGGDQVIQLASEYGTLARLLLVAPSGVGLSDLAFSPSGDYIAYLATTPGLGSQIGAVDVSSGASALLSTLTGMTQPQWSPFGSEVSALKPEPGAADTSEVVTLQLSLPPQASPGGGQANTALDTASNLAQLQIAGGSSAASAIQALITPGREIPGTILLPGSFDRFYAVSSTPLGVGSSDYQVELELVRDATASQPAAYLQEEVVVDPGNPPTIYSISAGALTDFSVGPQVVQETTVTGPGTTTFLLHFDADLNPVTVGPQSVSLTVSGRPVPNLQIGYQAASRELEVSASNLPAGPLVLTVGPPLADVRQEPIAVPYQLSLPTAPTS